MEEFMRINNTKRSLILLLALMLWITASAALAEHTHRAYTTRRARAGAVYGGARSGHQPLAEDRNLRCIFYQYWDRRCHI